MTIVSQHSQVRGCLIAVKRCTEVVTWLSEEERTEGLEICCILSPEL